MNIGIVGCGSIAAPYIKDLQARGLVVSTCYDTDTARAEALAQKFGLRMADPALEPEVTMVVNLTSPGAHYEVTRHALDNGKHVYSEKPLATNIGHARDLCRRAMDLGLMLGCSPFVDLGPPQAAMRNMVLDGIIGWVGLAYADMNWGRIEDWHPDPGSLYQVGPMTDVGVYPIHLLVSMFGPVAEVHAFGQAMWPVGQARFIGAAPEYQCAHLVFRHGLVARVTAQFYAHGKGTRQKGLELHGDKGSLLLRSCQDFDSELLVSQYGHAQVPVRTGAQPGTPWGLGAARLADAISSGSPNPQPLSRTFHVTQVLLAITQAIHVRAASRIPEEGQPW